MRKPTDRIALLLALAVSTPFGCARPLPNAPISGSHYSLNGRADGAGPAVQGAYFPLVVGNRWAESADDHYQIVNDAGAIVEDFSIHSDIKLRLTGTEVLNGSPYFLQELITTQSSRTDTVMQWIRYRQDATGLYEADLALNVPPGSEDPFDRSAGNEALVPLAVQAAGTTEGDHAAYQAAWAKLQVRASELQSLIHSNLTGAGEQGPPGGVRDKEITRLRYPLRPGATWVIRDDPFFGSTVEGLEALAVPAGTIPTCRIRIDSELLQPGESALFWMSRSGEVAERYHLKAEATDVNGNTIGFLTFDHDLRLESLSLLKP